jgi:hypothetical protein
MEKRDRIICFLLIVFSLLLSLYLSREFSQEKMSCYQDCNNYGVFKSTYILYLGILVSTFALNIILFIIGKKSKLVIFFLMILTLLMLNNIVELLRLPIKTYLDYALLSNNVRLKN